MGGRPESGWCARGRPYPKLTQNEFVFRKKSRFMAQQVYGGVRVRGAAIGRRAPVCVRAPARPLTIPTARAARRAIHPHRSHIHSHTFTRALAIQPAPDIYLYHLFYFKLIKIYLKCTKSRVFIFICFNVTYYFSTIKKVYCKHL